MISNNSDSYQDGIFMDPKFSEKVEVIFSNTEFEVSFKAGCSEKRLCFITVEKIEQKGLIQIRINDKSDRTKLLLTTIDAASFDVLKQDQSLHVTFYGFVDNLIKMLKECEKGSLSISISENSGSYFLQLYEYRQFKNLIHLSLPVKQATLNTVLFVLDGIVNKVQKENVLYERKLCCMQNNMRKKDEEINELQKEKSQLIKELTEQENHLSLRYRDEMNCLRQKIKQLQEEKDTEEYQHKDYIAVMQTKMDQLISESSSLKSEKTKDLKKLETLRGEIHFLQQDMVSLKDRNEKLNMELASIKNLERKNEMHLRDARQHIQSLQEKNQKYEKNQSELKAELEAEKKISHSKRLALEIATEELSKTNEQIHKQANEINTLRKTIDWRTEVALQQELAIKEKERQILEKEHQMQELREIINNLQREANNIPKEIEALKNFADKLESKFNGKICELKKKLECNAKDESTTKGKY